MSDPDNERITTRVRRVLDDSTARERKDVEGFWSSSAGSITAISVLGVVVVAFIVSQFI